MAFRFSPRFRYFVLLFICNFVYLFAQNNDLQDDAFNGHFVTSLQSSFQQTQINGRVYRDINGNGTQDIGEPGLENIDIIIVDVSFVSQAVSTDVNGDWSASVEVGAVNINVDNTDLPVGYVQTEGEDPTTIVALSGVSNYGGIDGYFFVGEVTGHLYFDLNGNGNQDDGEPDMPNIDVVVTDDFGTEQTVTTNANGDWSATVAALGASADIDETDPDFPADAVQTEGEDPSSLTVIAGQENFTDNDGFYLKGFLTGHLYFDQNANGAQDLSEPNMPNVDVEVTDSQGVVYVVATDANGDWEIEIPAGPATDEILVTDPDFPFGAIQTEGTNPTTTTVINNQTAFSENDGFYEEGEITGHLYFDVNGNGMQDTGEPNMPNVVVVVTDFLGNNYSVLTDVDGNWDILVPAGETIANIDETDPDFPFGATQTEGTDPTPTTVINNQTVFSENDGFYEEGELSGHLYFDLNGNGTQDAGEPNMPNVAIEITDSLGQIYNLITDANGNWVVQLPAGSATSLINVNDPDFPTLANQTQGTNPTITEVVNNQVVAEEPDGFFQQGSLTGHLYFDVNGNGVQDAGEADMANIEVTVSDMLGEAHVVQTDSEGNWEVLNIPVGNASVLINENDPDFPTGAVQTEGNNPSNTTVVVNETTFTENDGFYEVGILIGRLYYDLNNNGIQDIGEPGLENIDIEITDALGNVFIVVTNINGDWQANIPSGETISDIDENDPDFIFELSDQTQGTDPTTTLVQTGEFVNEEPDGFYDEGELSGHLYYDTNGNGTQDAGEPNLPNVEVVVTNVAGVQITVETDLNGNWSLVLPVGETTSEVNENDLDFPQDVVQTEGTNPTTHIIDAENPSEEIDGYFNPDLIIETLIGHLYYDVDGNGVQDPGEPNLPNVDVQVTDSNGGVLVVETDVNGNWSVEVPVGNTTSLIDVNDPDFFADISNIVQTEGTNPTTSTIVENSSISEIDGFTDTVLENTTLSGHLYFDYNNNGTQDAGDANMPNVEVEITNVFGQVSTVITDNQGNWTANVPVGSAVSNINEADPDFPTGSIQTEGTDPTNTFIEPGIAYAEVNDGFYNEDIVISDINGHVYYDTNGDGIQQLGEPDLSFITVQVTDVFGGVQFLETDNDGNWVTQVPEGNTIVFVDENDPDFPIGSIQTEGTNPTTISVVEGASNSQIDGFHNPDVEIAQLSGHLYYDTNGNSSQEIGESNIPNVEVIITTFLGNEIIAETDANGDWFVSIPAGSTVSLINVNDTDFPTGATQTQGTNPTSTNVEANVINVEIDGFYLEDLETSTLMGHVYYDYSGNGDQENNEANIAELNVLITNALGLTSTIETDANGDWSILVPVGNTESKLDETDPEYPTGFTQTEGTDPTTTAVIANIMNTETDDGFFNEDLTFTSASGHVYYDTNGNGTQDVEEPDLPNIDVIVTDNFGAQITVETDADGNWSLNLPEGSTMVLVDTTDPDFPIGSIQTEGTNPTTINVVEGAVNSQIDGFHNPDVEIAQLSGHLYYDTNGNALQEIGEPNIPNVEVTITTSLGNEIIVETDANGDWFVFIPTGSTVSLINVNDLDFPAGAIQTEGTNPTTTTAVVGSANQEIDGFYLEDLETSTLTGHVYYDYSGNGDQENNEADIAELNVLITNVLGLTSTIETDANGDWSILVPVGNTESKLDEADPEYPTGFTQTEGTDPTTTAVVANITNTETDDGFFNEDLTFTSASGHVYYDTNGNGTQDVGEPDLPNIDVIVTDNFGAQITVETDADGNWSLNLPEGNTTVLVDTADPDFPIGSIQTEGTNPTIIDVAEGANNSQIDGFHNPDVEIAQLSGHLYYDTNGNSSQEIGEPNLPNVEVSITTSLGNEIIIETDLNGDWSVFIPTGSTVSLINVNDPDFPIGAIQTQGTNPTTTNVLTGVTNQEIDGFYLEDLETSILTGHVYYDYSGNGDQESNEADIAELNVLITNALGLTSTIETDANGDWSVLVPVGNTESKLDEADPEYPTGFTQTEGTDPTTTAVVANITNTETDDGFFNEDLTFTSASGHVYYDTNGNGTQDVGEPDLPNIDVFITDVLGGNFILTTDSNGDWSINLPEGNTVVEVNENDPDFPIGAIQTEGTNPTTINLVDNGANSQIDGFFLPNVGTGTLTGHLYYDTNGNGVQDNTEPNLPNIDVIITNVLGLNITIETDANGDWSILLPEGNSTSNIDETDPDFNPAFVQTQGTDPTTSVVTANNIVTETPDGFNIPSLQNNTLSGHLYFDFNGNGSQDLNESDMASVDVVITNSLGLVVTVETDINGDWSILVPEGNATSNIDETDPDFPNGLVQTEGTDPTTTNIVAGSAITETPDGFFNPDFTTATLSGHLYYDTDGSGSQDAGEPNIPNVEVTITDFFGGVQILETDVNGNWSIEVPEGTTSSLVNVNDPDFPIGATQTEGTNPTTTNVVATNTNQEVDGFTLTSSEIASLSGHLYFDTNGNATQDTGEPNLPNVDVEVTNSLGLPVILETDVNGDWSITVPDGNTTSLIDITDPDFPTGATQTEGTNPTTQVLSFATPVSEIDGFTATNVNTAIISGHVYYDSNGNGTQEAGEPDLANIDVEVVNSFNIAFVVETDANGDWSLLVPEGNTMTTVNETDPDFPIGAIQTEGTNPTTTNVVVGGSNSEIDGYNNPDLATGELSGHIYYDTNGNAVQDTGEPDLSNITVTITDAFGVVYPLESDVNGNWVISLPVGNTTSLIDVNDVDFPISATQTEGTNPTITNVTENSATQEIDGFTNTNLDVGELTGHIYYDIDGNGNQDAGEPDLANIDVEVINSVGVIQIVVSDANGDWSVSVPTGTTTSLIDEVDPDFIPGAVQTEGNNPTNTVVTANTTVTEIDGYTVPVSSLGEIVGHMYIDINGNAAQDTDEPDLPNVDVLVTDFLGGQQIVTSNATGDWMVNVIPGQTTSDIDEADADIPIGAVQTQGTDPTTHQVDLVGSFMEIDGFFVPELSSNTLNGHVYFDTNGNGNQEVGEINLNNIEVEVTDELDNIMTVFSDIDGNWTVGVPEGEVSSFVKIQSSPAFSNVTQSEGTNPTITDVTIGQDYFEVDGYFIREATLDDLEVFNAISPNGDGKNDFMVIEGIEKFPDNTLIIFNRWGTRVYDVTGYGQNEKYFRGISEGRVTVKEDAKLPSGTYFYILEVKSNNGEVLKKEGYLYIN